MELATLGNGKGRVARIANDVAYFGNGLLGSQRDNVGLESCFEALYLAYLGTLLVYWLTDGQNADPA